jgi:hypothetical protein
LNKLKMKNKIKLIPILEIFSNNKNLKKKLQKNKPLLNKSKTNFLKLPQITSFKPKAINLMLKSIQEKFKK